MPKRIDEIKNIVLPLFESMFSEAARDNKALLDEVARALEDDEHSFEERQEQLLGYVQGKHVPGFQMAWLMGEVLRQRGFLPWCSGLWLLWVCGHLEEVVRIVARVAERDPDGSLVAQIWELLALADARATDVVRNGAGFRRAKRSRNLTYPKASLLSWLYISQERRVLGELQANDIVMFPRAAYDWAWTAWLRYDRVRTAVASAVSDTIASKDSHSGIQRDHLTRLTAPCIAASQIYGLSLSEHKLVLLTMMKIWSAFIRERKPVLVLRLVPSLGVGSWLWPKSVSERVDNL